MHVTPETLIDAIAKTHPELHVECVRCHPDAAAAMRAAHPTLPIFVHADYPPSHAVLVRRRGEHPGTPPEPCDGTPYP